MKNKHKLLYVASAILSISILLIGRERVVRFFVGIPTQKVGLAVIKNEFERIKIHDDDRWIESPSAFDKNSIDGVSGNLRSNAAPAEIISYYRSVARGLGWIEVDSRKGGDGQSVKFCKNGVSLFVDASNNGSTTSYYLGAVWTEYSALESYCPPDK